MALELWWGSGSPYSWRALLALEFKELPYVSHQVQFAKQEHKSPQLVAMNPRGVRSVERSICIMLDVLRASSTMLAMFQAGARELRLAELSAGSRIPIPASRVKSPLRPSANS